MAQEAWPEHKLSELQRLARLNCYTGSQIGELIGATRSAVLGKLLRLGIRLKAKHDSRWTPALALSAWVLAEQGTAAAVIAERIGHGLTAKDVNIKIWNMKAQRQKRALTARAKRAKVSKLPPRVVARPLRPARIAADASPLSLRFLELGAGQCRYPLGGDYDRPEFFCGATVETGRPYCSPHCALAFRPVGRIAA